MGTPQETTWEIEPHTFAKHKILENYLKAWFPILATYNPRIIYLDGFSGPGIYKGGEKGSPIIALLTAHNHPRIKVDELVFLFIEEEQDRVENLKTEIGKLSLPPHFKIHVEHGEFHSVLSDLLNKLESGGKNLAPTFAFIDPFGFAGLPFKLVARILSYPKSEVFITFMVYSINRFVGSPDENTITPIVDLFGTTEVLSIPKTVGDRTERLRMLYQSQLEKISGFVRYFEMCDKDGRPIYYLFFASNNELGHSKMKEAMWKVDKEGDFRFSDKTDPDQIVLFQQDHSSTLFNILNKKFSKQKKSVGELNKFVSKTPYIEKHLKGSLKYGEEMKLINVDEKKMGGEKRIKGTFPNDVLITFL